MKNDEILEKIANIGQKWGKNTQKYKIGDDFGLIYGKKQIKTKNALIEGENCSNFAFKRLHTLFFKK